MTNLTKEQQAVAVKMAMEFENELFHPYWMKQLVESLDKSPILGVHALLEFLRTASTVTNRLYNEIVNFRQEQLCN